MLLSRISLFSLILLAIFSCNAEQPEYTAQDYEYLGISHPDKLSAASKRALERNYHKHAEWFGEFHRHGLTGDLNYEKGVTRRDPSKVIFVNGLYYTYYTRTLGPGYGFSTGDPEKKVFPWDKSEVWYATSKDGWHWEEQGLAVGRGAAGRYDDRSVFTPEILAHGGKYYLVYQAIRAPYLNRSKNTVGMAVAQSPKGPWISLDSPILQAANNGEWLGNEDNRFLVKKQGHFDSHKVHDPTLMYYKNKFYLYYKGERMGEKITAGGREIRWGVAIADKPEGPYTKSPYNPITHSGHELHLWHYKGGIAMVSGADGPEKETIQYAEDGINFEIMAYVNDVPFAMGLVESLDNDEHPTAGLAWGLYHETVIEPGQTWMSGYNFIKRFGYSRRTNNIEFINKK